MFKSVKATYTFSRKIKLTYLTASKSEKQNIPARSSHEKIYGCQYYGGK